MKYHSGYGLEQWCENWQWGYPEKRWSMIRDSEFRIKTWTLAERLGYILHSVWLGTRIWSIGFHSCPFIALSDRPCCQYLLHTALATKTRRNGSIRHISFLLLFLKNKTSTSQTSPVSLSPMQISTIQVNSKQSNTSQVFFSFLDFL